MTPWWPPHQLFMYYVYLLESTKDKKLYIGYTPHLKSRLHKHANGLVQATKARRPLTLVYIEAYRSKKDAMKRERNLKLFSKAYYGLKQRISNSLYTE